MFTSAWSGQRQNPGIPSSSNATLLHPCLPFFWQRMTILSFKRSNILTKVEELLEQMLFLLKARTATSTPFEDAVVVKPELFSLSTAMLKMIGFERC